MERKLVAEGSSLRALVDEARFGLAVEWLHGAEIPEIDAVFGAEDWTGIASYAATIEPISLEPIGPNRTRFSFEERYHLTKAPWKWFEGYIYKFINKKNEESMRAASQWLTDHPEFRPDLVDDEAHSVKTGQ